MYFYIVEKSLIKKQFNNNCYDEKKILSSKLVFFIN